MSTVECPCGLVIPVGPADRLSSCPACGHALPARPARPATLPVPSLFTRPVTLFDVADWLAADRHRPKQSGRVGRLVVWSAVAVGVVLAVLLSGAAAWLVTHLSRR